MLNRMIAVAIATASISAAAHGSPNLKLSITTGQGPVPPGGIVQVSVSMLDLGGQPAAGFQAFVHFDPTKLQFINGSYTSVPFGLAVIPTISATPSGDIDLASGINQFAGQMPS